jgi:hypothetical protein
VGVKVEGLKHMGLKRTVLGILVAKKEFLLFHPQSTFDKWRDDLNS